MITASGRLFSREEIDRACLRLEKTFGTAYFKKGIGILKDSDPAGPGMGRMAVGGRASRLLIAWYRAREELAYADLEGSFRPGLHSAVIGVLGKSLEALCESPGLARSAGDLLDDASFDRTFFLLWVAAGFNPSPGEISFPGHPGGFFFTSRMAAGCLRPESTPSPGPPDPGLFSASVLEPLLEFSRLLPGAGFSGRRPVLYVDLSDFPVPPEEVAKLMETSWDEAFGMIDRNIEAVVFCRGQFIPGTGGVRWKTSGCPLFRKKNAGPVRAGENDIYLP